MITEERKVGPKSQVVIPKVFRDHLGIEPGEDVKVTLEDGNVVIQKKGKDMMKLMVETATYSADNIVDSDTNYEEMMEERWNKST